ncbi:MAG: hypothetical protein E7326_02240 [Clostridiales bacterium]|nr:hypothetical protein [Clostridiales bacterium]
MTLQEMQKAVYQNKLDHHFNVKNVELEFQLLQGEVEEACEAWKEQKSDLGEELADVAIYLLGLAEILHFDLGKEIERKMEINRKRKYQMVDGVLKKVQEDQ